MHSKANRDLCCAVSGKKSGLRSGLRSYNQSLISFQKTTSMALSGQVLPAVCDERGSAAKQRSSCAAASVAFRAKSRLGYPTWHALCRPLKSAAPKTFLTFLLLHILTQKWKDWNEHACVLRTKTRLAIVVGNKHGVVLPVVPKQKETVLWVCVLCSGWLVASESVRHDQAKLPATRKSQSHET